MLKYGDSLRKSFKLVTLRLSQFPELEISLRQMELLKISEATFEKSAVINKLRWNPGKNLGWRPFDSRVSTLNPSYYHRPTLEKLHFNISPCSQRRWSDQMVQLRTHILKHPVCIDFLRNYYESFYLRIVCYYLKKQSLNEFKKYLTMLLFFVSVQLVYIF